MRRRTLALAVGAPLILAGAAEARFTGIAVEARPNEFGLLVCNVYAEFDGGDADHMVAVAGTPEQTLDIHVVNGTFHQHPFGGDRPPNPALFDAEPALRYDTFVTIGVKSFNPNDPGNPEGSPEDAMVLTPTWPGFASGELVLENDGWGVTPDNAQGDPFGRDTVPGDGRVLIGQFSTADGAGIVGTMRVLVFANGEPEEHTVSFAHGETGCPWDLTGNGIVDGADLYELRLGYGPCKDPADCPADFDGDGFVGLSDRMALLENLGHCPGACPGDVDGDGRVGPRDLIEVLSHFGPCRDPDRCPWDINGDGTVDAGDFGALLSGFGPCPR